MQSSEFYQTHLDSVSRSFAFCIARLRFPLRLWVSHSYLLCRTLDTIEDAPWSNLENKLKAFRSFEAFLSCRPDEKSLLHWQESLPKKITSAEYTLIRDFHFLLDDFHQWPDSVKSHIRRAVLSMSHGMSHFSQIHSQESLLLKNLQEVNQYCFFVAGLVGELLTDLVLVDRSALHLRSNVYLKAHHFGLFLQKINLLKDHRDDEKAQRFLVPNRAVMWASLNENAHQALEYITSLPVTESDYRLFCAWSLFLGLFSIPWIEKTWTTRVLDKIPRAFTERVLGQVESIIDDNKALSDLFREQIAHIPVPRNLVQTNSPTGRFVSSESLNRRLQSETVNGTDRTGEDQSWLFKIYNGNLQPPDLKNLGLL